MISEKKLAANRANAKKSTGPRTQEGKARACLNARKHGLTATAYPVVRLEDPDALTQLTADLVAVYQPINSQELFALESVAIAQLGLRRAERLHSGMFTLCLNETISADDRPFKGISPHLVDEDHQIVKQQNRSYLLADGFQRLTSRDNSFALMLRYRTQCERLYRRAIEDFERVKAQRADLNHDLLNEPTAAAQPEDSATTCPSPETHQKPTHPPEHYGPDGELRFPYDRPDWKPTPLPTPETPSMA